ncbi:MAG: oligosaccharide flippase family protein, partial [Candidatus Binatia bacterium]
VVATALAATWLTFPLLAHYLVGTEAAGELRKILLVLGWLPVLETINSYPGVLLQRRMDLTYLAAVRLLQPLMFVGLGLAFLRADWGSVGIAFANVVAMTVIVLLLWARMWRTSRSAAPGWPRFAVWREVGTGSLRVFVGGFGGFLSERVDNLLVAGSIGPRAMSFYSMAWNASRALANVFSRAIDFVLVPTLARIHEEPERMRRASLDCLRYSYMLLSPASAMLFVCSPSLVAIVLGTKWSPLVPCLRVMCITIIATPLLHAINALLVAAGRAHLTGIATTLHILTLGVVIPPLSNRFGPLGAAYGDLAAVFILTATLCVTFHRVARQFDWSFLGTATRPAIAAVLAGTLGWQTGNQVAGDGLRLVWQLGVISVAYLAAMVCLGGARRLWELFALLKTALQKAGVDPSSAPRTTLVG